VTDPGEREPPRYVWFTLDEALELLAALEDARDVLANTPHLTVLVEVEEQVRRLNRRLEFDEPD
jgi:hypothetical protein